MRRDKLGSKRYAEAVFEIAQENNQLEEWRQGLEKITSVLEIPELKVILVSPKLSFESKRKLLQECLKDILPSALNLVYLLVAKGRTNLVALIKKEYDRLLDSFYGIERIKIITAVPIEDNVRGMLIDKLEKLTSNEVVSDFELNPAILGGIVIKIGDKLIDGGLKTRLETLKKNLHTAG